VRYVVIPMRPGGTEGLDPQAELARLVTRDAMIGTGLALPAAAPHPQQTHERCARHGRHAVLRPVQPEADEPLFHADWEKRALALTLAMGATGQWNIDLSRSARESLPPAVYLGSSYYEIWIRALEVLMRERGLVSDDELTSGTAAAAGRALPRIAGRGGRCRSGPRLPDAAPGPGAPARFAPGDRVVARNLHPTGHTRLPRYVRGHTGTVQLVHGAHLFADTPQPPAAAAVRRHRPLALHGGVRRPRPVGPAGRARAAGQRRRLGALPGAAPA
jgi:nitrile hydratase beta subunit